MIIRFINDRNCEYVRRMRKAGADIDALTGTDTPLVLAAALRTDWDVVWCLLDAGAKFNYPPGPPEFNLTQLLDDPFPSPDSPIYPYKVKVRDFLRAKGLPTPALRDDGAASAAR